MNVNQVLAKDLRLLEKMAADMDAYLTSECTHWTMGNGDAPCLTIGGYLMRQHRLQALCKELQVVDQERLRKAVEQFDKAMSEKVVRFEKRAHQELHLRLRDWLRYLGGLSTHRKTQVAAYSSMVDTRVVIAATVNKLQTPPYQLDAEVVTETKSLDRNLRSQWQAGAFVWDPVWQPAYPADEYWWLYGQPMSGRA